MPGGQMAPPTMIGQKATTCQTGRNPFINGNPINVSEMLSQLIGPAYIERVSTHDLKNVIKTKKAIKKALQYQLDGKGFSMVEVLSTCPTNWKMTPIEAADYIKNEMTKIFPLGVFKDKEAGK
jgi:2-oxoglutarate ferredoxin oxidoreductase subunit beta